MVAGRYASDPPFDVPFTFTDRSAKADFRAGRQELDAKEALSFVRARKAFPTGDFQRQLNGGTFLIGALIAAKVRATLLAGIRSAVLWRQSGGNRWQLIFGRRKIIEQAGRLLKGLDAENRALLDLSLRRGMADEEIAVVLNVTTPEARERIETVLGRLADELGLEDRAERDELRATLPDLPPELWKG